MAAAPGFALASSSPAQLLDAMEATASAAFDASIHDSVENMFEALPDLGVLSPVMGSGMALIYSGDVELLPSDANHDYPSDPPEADMAVLSFKLKVPAWANSLRFSYFFLSRELSPQWIVHQNQHFGVEVDSVEFSAGVTLGLGANVVGNGEVTAGVVGSKLLAGTGFEDGGGTGWVTMYLPAEPGEIISIRFEVRDAAGGSLDCAVLLDGLAFLMEDVSWPEGEVGPPALGPDSDGDGQPDEQDCAPLDPAAGPFFPEICDGIDNDCDPGSDESVDGDGDGVSLCDGDCDDNRLSVGSTQSERAGQWCEDGLDNDCDGLSDADDPGCLEDVEAEVGCGDAPTAVLVAWPLFGLAGRRRRGCAPDTGGHRGAS